MPVAVIATGIASAVAAVAIYARKKRAEKRSDARIVERLASIAPPDPIAARRPPGGVVKT